MHQNGDPFILDSIDDVIDIFVFEVDTAVTHRLSVHRGAALLALATPPRAITEALESQADQLLEAGKPQPTQQNDETAPNVGHSAEVSTEPPDSQTPIQEPVLGSGSDVARTASPSGEEKGDDGDRSSDPEQPGQQGAPDCSPQSSQGEQKVVRFAGDDAVPAVPAQQSLKQQVVDELLWVPRGATPGMVFVHRLLRERLKFAPVASAPPKTDRLIASARQPVEHAGSTYVWAVVVPHRRCFLE